MGLTTVVPAPEPPHQCTPPWDGEAPGDGTVRYGVGTAFTCDDCDRTFAVEESRGFLHWVAQDPHIGP